MIFFQRSSPVTIAFGPFLDETDGKTPETALGLVASDIRISKIGGAFAAKSEASAPTHMENGYYRVDLNSTDTTIAGALRIHCHKTGALPVWMEAMVMYPTPWSAMFSSGGMFQANVEQWRTVPPNVLAAGRVDVSVGTILAGVVDPTAMGLPTGAVATDAGNSALAFKTDLTSTTDNFWKDALLLFWTGALAGQVKKVLTYNGTTKVIGVKDGFTATPADASTFFLINR